MSAKPEKIRLLSVEAMIAIYEEECRKRGLPFRREDCDEEKLRGIVKRMKDLMPAGTAIEYVSGEEIREDLRREREGA